MAKCTIHTIEYRIELTAAKECQSVLAENVNVVTFGGQILNYCVNTRHL